uniref:Uncharacterized protein n=1 Tax=Aegilops tauschii subsp. strangulata TaxID=200361 RepID=A0A453II34_AEGTS
SFRVWASPLGFRPERHLAGDDATMALSEPELRFVSFSTGRRAAPGSRWAPSSLSCCSRGSCRGSPGACRPAWTACAQDPLRPGIRRGAEAP